MSFSDNENTALQPIADGVIATSDVIILPALKSEFGSENLTAIMDAYQEKAAERKSAIIVIDPYGRSADA